MFERTKDTLAELQTSYERWDGRGSSGAVLAAHRAVIGCATGLLVESALAFADDDDELTGSWSELGTEGAMALVKTVELARAHDPELKLLAARDRSYLLTWAALEAYRCGRFGISAAVLKRPDATLPIDLARSPSLLAARVLQAVGRARLKSAWEVVDSARAEVRGQASEVKEGVLAWHHQAAWLAVGSLCQSILEIKNHLDTGQRDALGAARTWLDRALRLAEASRDNEVRLFLESFERAFTSLRKLSIWNMVAMVWPNETPEYVRAWASNRIAHDRAFLFPSQYEALIGRQVLSRPRALVSLPTGGGKSLLAEVFALRALATDPASKVLLIVPSRALAAEKREELQDGLAWPGSPFTVCQLTGDVPLDAESAITEHSVTVLTPEKFDTVLRADFFPTIPLGALMVDEFHTLRMSYRGIKLQLSLVRFRERYPQIPSLFISAIVRGSDFEALSRWAHAPDPFSSDWKPTPSRIGLVDLAERPTLTIKFNDGIMRRVVVPPKLRRDAAEKASIPLLRDLVSDDQVLYFQLYWRSHGGNHLYDVASEILQDGLAIGHLDGGANRELTEKLERLAGAEEPMVEFFRKGIGLHWGMLPQAARRLIEEGIRRRALGLVLATSTLAEGVNLPIKTVYLRKLGTRHRDLEMGTFLNVVGRAGRPFFHPEGQVVIGYCESGSGRTPQERAEHYASMDRNHLEALITAAVGAARLWVECADDGLINLATLEPKEQDWEQWHNRRGMSTHQRTAVESQQDRVGEVMAEIENFSGALLAALVESHLKSLERSDLLSEALFLGPETQEDQQLVWRFVAAIRLRLIRLEAIVPQEDRDSVTPWGLVVYRTGFGPESCVRLRTRLDFLDGFPTNIRWQELLSLRESPAGRFWRTSRFLLVQPYERWKMDREPRKALNMFLLGGWAAGISLDDVRAQMRSLTRQDRDLAEPEQRLYLDVFTEVEGLLAAWAAWVFYASAQIADYLYPDEGWRSRLEKLARIVLYGHWNGSVRRVLQRDLTGRVIRDDVVLLFRYGGEALIRRILAGELSRAELFILLGRLPTRLPPDELADLLLAVAEVPVRT